MKKLLLTEGLIACFFLALFLGFFGKFLSRGQGEWDRGTGKSGQQCSDGLTVYSGVLQEKFSPLDYQTKGEENVFAMCFSNLLSRDSEGRRNNKPVDAAWGSEDKQLAHISVSEDAWKDISVVTIRLNHEAETPLGKKVDAKDLLFNIYLRCSITANDTAPFGGVRILGQEEYVYGAKDIEGRKKELQGMLMSLSSCCGRRLWSRSCSRNGNGSRGFMKMFRMILSVRNIQRQRICLPIIILIRRNILQRTGQSSRYFLIY